MKMYLRTKIRIYLKYILITKFNFTFEASGAPETFKENGEPVTCSPAYLIVKACFPASCGLIFRVKVASP